MGRPVTRIGLSVFLLAGATARADTISSREDIRLAQNTSGAAVTRRCPPITITQTAGGTAMNSTDDLRVRIPSSLPGVSATWDTSDQNIIAVGTGSNHVASSTVTYEGSDRVVVIQLNSTVDDGDVITIYGLKFSIPFPSTVNAVDELELIIDGSASGATEASDDKKITIYETSLDTTANINLNHSGSATLPSSKTLGRLTVTDVSGTGVNPTSATDDIRVRIPSTLGFAWDTSVTSPAMSGVTGKVGSTVSYESSGTVLRIDATLTGGFASGEAISLDGLAFLPSFAGGTLAADSLEMLLDGGTAVATIDRRVFARSSGTKMQAVAQTIGASAANAVLNSVSITAGATIGTGTFTGDIRISIPFESNLSFDASNATGGTVTVTTTSGAVSSTPAIEDTGDGNRTLLFDVTSAISAGGIVSVIGLVVDNAGAAETPELLLGVSGPGAIDAVLSEIVSAAATALGGGGGGGGDFVQADPGARGLFAVLLGAVLAVLAAAFLRRRSL